VTDEDELKAALTPLINQLSLGRVHPAVGAHDVVTFAGDLLVAGMDSPALRELAGESPAARFRDIAPLIERTLEELGAALPSPEEDQRRALWVMCEGLLEGTVTPRELTSWAVTVFAYDGPESARDLANLDNDFDGAEADWGLSTVAQVIADVEALARRVVAAERRALLYPRPVPTVRTAITGGTGFVGRHVEERFAPGQAVAISRRTGVDVENEDALAKVFEGCEVVVHSAGINREIGDQTYERVHVDGTRKVIAAAKRAGVSKIIMLSFLRARPDCGSPYHESKWAAEQLIRESGLDYTILKAGMIYGHGDHLVDHLSRTVATLPFFATVGFREKPIRPIPIADLVDIVVGAVNGRMSRETVSVTGAEQLLLSDAVRRVARLTGKRVWVLRAPVWAVYALAQITEWTMRVPLIAKAQVRMLAEGVAEAWGDVTQVPEELAPTLRFTDEQIRAALPPPGGFRWRDLRAAR
jgi:NADH dehydrogenase